jgi:NAD(P)-dependent dehydrogenase (short-subunit alcohol dehydrogenase family)
MRLANQVVLVTGGGRAIGRRITLRAGRDGARVAILGPERGELEATAGELQAEGREVLAMIADVTREEEVTASVQRALDEFGRIDVLVNNAGIVGPTAPVQEVPRAEWEAVLAVNLTGAFLCAKAVLPGMIARRAGKIVNIASVAGKQAYPLRAPYAVSKWGLIGLTLTLAKEAGPHNIQVNALCPGPVEGARMRGIIEQRAQELGQTPAEVEATYLRTTALGRFAREDDVAEWVIFLASTAGDNVTGQAIDVAAGYGL